MHSFSKSNPVPDQLAMNSNRERTHLHESARPHLHESARRQNPATESQSASKFAFSFSKAGASSRDEMNLAEFPLAVLSTRSNPNIKTLEFSDHHRQPNGELSERKWIITGADKFGLPTSTDDDVVLGLMRMSMDQGFRNRKVYFTRYELLKTLRWSTEGRSYSRLIKSLDRLSGVRIRSSNAFYDNSSKAYQTRNFGIIDAYEIVDNRAKRVSASRKGADEENSKSFFIWSEVLFNSFKSGFVKKLDLDFYFALKSAVSRRLYRYLDKHFYYKSTVEIPLHLLAFEKIGLSRSYKYVSSIKQQLEPAGEELIALGFLSTFEVSGRGEQAVARFRACRGGINDNGVLSNAPLHQQGEGSKISPATKLFRALVGRGIAEPQARRLVRKKSASDCLKLEPILAYYDHLLATNDRKVSKNAVGFLYRAVEAPHRFTVPDEFAEASLSAARVPGGAARGRGRPELKVFTSSARSQAAEAVPSTGSASRDSVSAPKGNKQSISDAEVAAAASALGTAGVEEVRAAVEKRMLFLKSVLQNEHYEEALGNCIREELVKAVKS